MANRSKDWLAQAKRDLNHSVNSCENGDFEWSCFSAQQAAEKAVKAVFLHLHGEGWGHSVFGLLRAIGDKVAVSPDLLIILRQSGKRFLDRIPDFIPENLSVGCDVFPYTSEEVEKMKQEGRHWIHHVLSEAVWL